MPVLRKIIAAQGCLVAGFWLYQNNKIKCTVIEPPAVIRIPSDRKSVFLAGSIDLGKALNWQQEVIDKLSDVECVILNPLRKDWDATWEQNINNPQFVEQVTWELDALEKATCIVFYLAPGSLAPISLMELGLFARSGKVVVCCPEGFWRKGNVDLVCRRYNVEQVDSLTALVSSLRLKLQT